MAVIPHLGSVPRRRRWVNRTTRYVVALGGAGVIGAIALIFFYLLWVIAPIFAPAGIEDQGSFSLPATDSRFVDVSENGEIGLQFAGNGNAYFFDINTGRIVATHNFGYPIESVKPLLPIGHRYLVRAQSGEVQVVDANYRVSFVDDVRKVNPTLNYPFEEDPIQTRPGSDLEISIEDFEAIVVSVQGRALEISQYREVEEGFPLEFPRTKKLRLERAYNHVFLGPRAQWVYLVADDGAVEVLDIRRPNSPKTLSTSRLVPDGVTMTAVAPLLGRYSLLVGDSKGQVTQWFMVRDDYGHELKQVRAFHYTSPAARIVGEQRRKGFAVLDAAGSVHLGYTTSERKLAHAPLDLDHVATMTISPRSNLLLAADGNGKLARLALHNEHPEISWSALWEKVWYEGYSEPVYSWQSSSADNDFEPKFSLTPLLFGTLKAAFYAMLFATPLAIMGAIYTAYFMAPSMRRLVKPGIEIMAALPTVILGFLAGLWVAPMLEANLSSVISILLVLPPGLMILAWLWSLLPGALTRPFTGWYGLVAIVPIFAMVGFSFWLGPVLETLFFGGDSRAWFLNEMGLSYDQRNAMVVGLAMGLAVIPTIFSIAEDAIYGVPTHLINGSLALGATPWQTLVRVVLLTASPGIFSAVMIGLGRAVGETMIVLMATGNTPIMDLNIFEGMRTFAANIAVELPESEVASTHYRILFLAAMVLFMITFAFNTAAEIVRQRLRARYGSL